MLIHSIMYKKHYPFIHNTEIQQLDETERAKLAKYIRYFPGAVRAKNFEAAMAASKGSVGSTYWVNFQLRKGYNNISDLCTDLADKVAKGTGLTDEEIRDVNTVLYAHKYNWLWSLIIPMPINTKHPNMRSKER